LRRGVARAGKTDRGHPGGPCRADAERRILDDNAVARRNAEARGREQEQVRRRFALRHLLRGEDSIAEQRREPGNLERQGDALALRGRGDAAWLRQRSNRLARAGDRLEAAPQTL